MLRLFEQKGSDGFLGARVVDSSELQNYVVSLGF
jgi:hypothetical protein